MKRRLILETLVVDSFHTALAAQSARGTVRAHQDDDGDAAERAHDAATLAERVGQTVPFPGVPFPDDDDEPAEA